jgi:hypothetical protein
VLVLGDPRSHRAATSRNGLGMKMPLKRPLGVEGLNQLDGVWLGSFDF